MFAAERMLFVLIVEANTRQLLSFFFRHQVHHVAFSRSPLSSSSERRSQQVNRKPQGLLTVVRLLTASATRLSLSIAAAVVGANIGTLNRVQRLLGAAPLRGLEGVHR